MDTDFESILCTTPEQSKTVQLILFKKGYKWKSGHTNPLYTEDYSTYTISLDSNVLLSRLTYVTHTITAQEFIFLNHHILKE